LKSYDGDFQPILVVFEMGFQRFKGYVLPDTPKGRVKQTKAKKGNKGDLVLFIIGNDPVSE
jgi:hypothetical protein